MRSIRQSGRLAHLRAKRGGRGVKLATHLEAMPPGEIAAKAAELPDGEPQESTHALWWITARPSRSDDRNRHQPVDLVLSARPVMLLRMGNLYYYFAADDDAAAAATLEHAPDPERFDVLDVRGIEPTVQLATLEALLRGIDYELVAADPRQSALLSDPQDEERWVVTLSDTLRDALANADTEQLAGVAIAWSATEEFRGHGDADLLSDFLNRFAELARTARGRGQRLYC